LPAGAASRWSACSWCWPSPPCSINGGLLNAVVPVIVVLVTWLARDEHLSGRQALGLALSLFGVVVIVCRGHVSALWTLRFHLGDLILLAAMICFALYSLVVRRLPAGLHNLAVMVPAIAIALPALAGLYAWEFSATGPFPLSTGNLVILAYVIFGPAIVGYFCWMYGVRAVGANRAAFTYNLIPVFTVITAALFAGERLEPYHWAGFALNFAGMYLALIPGRRGAAIDAPTA
jgi:drug/metabolite transporter (DMT)-like permease